MNNKNQQRIVRLQRMLKVARDCLLKISHEPYDRRAFLIAEEALETLERIEIGKENY